MSDSISIRDHLARHGSTLVDQGYSIVPIQQGKKSPGFDGWQKSKAGLKQVKEWLEGGFKNAGVGILTKFTCAIDIDCLDETSSAKFVQWCLTNIGYAPQRIGKAPKTLLLYRTTEPFRKRTSTSYFDEWGDKQLIEVLGDGQQFVAFHVHPETGKPYYWIDEKSPLNIRAADLTEVKPEQIESLLREFETYAKAEKWKAGKSAHNGSTGSGNGSTDKDNPWVEDTQPITISDEEFRSRLLMVPNAEDYDRWQKVGMACYHQYGGDEIGLQMWIEWSETADNFDPDAIDRHWTSFNIEGKKRAPLTARYIIRLAAEAISKTALELGVKLRTAFLEAKDEEAWKKAALAVRTAEIDGITRSTIADVAQERLQTITGRKVPIYEIKKAISYLPKKLDKTPGWCEPWVWNTADDKFFNLLRKIAVTRQSFDAMYDRYAMTKKDILDGNNSASQSAGTTALNLYKITTVDGCRYMPGRDAIFHEPDGTFCNSYPEHEIPALPEKLLPRDERNVMRVRDHIAHLLLRPDEQMMLLDWLAWVVQNPGRHVNYAILLQGVEGDGKTFFAEMLRAVMGVSNVSMANANTVIKSDFTDWAYGHCVCCIEEIRLSSNRGVDKWEAINKIKPFITNNVIEIHPKGRPAMNVVNTTSYLLFSNFEDALPLDDNSRRYNVLFSKWQQKRDILAFKEANPNYYIRLYAALTESPGALRQWLLGHEVSPSFNPLGDAPDTTALKIMIRKSKSEFIQVLDEIITENETLEASIDLVDVTGLSDVMVAAGADWPGPKTLAALMERDNYHLLGKVRLPELGMHRFYSKNPRMFCSTDLNLGLTTDPTRIRDYLKRRRADLSDDGL